MLFISGLDFHTPVDIQSEKKKQPFSKPIPKSFQASWNTDGPPEPDRGTKRQFEGAGAGAGRGSQLPGHTQEGSRKENKPPGSGVTSYFILSVTVKSPC